MWVGQRERRDDDPVRVDLWTGTADAWFSHLVTEPYRIVEAEGTLTAGFADGTERTLVIPRSDGVYVTPLRVGWQPASVPGRFMAAAAGPVVVHYSKAFGDDGTWSLDAEGHTVETMALTGENERPFATLAREGRILVLGSGKRAAWWTPATGGIELVHLR